MSAVTVFLAGAAIVCIHYGDLVTAGFCCALIMGLELIRGDDYGH